MTLTSKVYIAGHNGLVGSALVRRLKRQGFSNLLLRTRSELDLLDSAAVQQFFMNERPSFVYLAAAKVGGIYANNSYPAEFIYENLQVQNNVIHACHVAKVEKLCFLGSSCIYPRNARQPMKEEYLLDGPLESTNEPYAIAKIAGIKMVQAYNRQYGLKGISVMPTNLFGPNDNFNLTSSHVLPALIRKFVEAAEIGSSSVSVWGSGNPRREFLHVDDMADACILLMSKYDSPEIINIGFGADITIRELAEMIKEEAGYKGRIEFDSSKPDGTPRKLLDVSKLNALGWKANIPLREGIRGTIEWYKKHRGTLKGE